MDWGVPQNGGIIWVDPPGIHGRVVDVVGKLWKETEFNEFLKSLRVSNDIQKLILANNGLDEDSSSKIVASLQGHSSLTKLVFGVNNTEATNCNKIGETGARALVSLMGSLTNLQCLKFYENEFGDSGFKTFSQGLQKMPSLASIRFSTGWRKTIPDTHLEHLASALRYTPTLTKLDLSFNGLNPKAAECLFNNIMHLKRLKILHLYQNYIGDAGAHIISQRLMTNTSLQVIRLGDNNITDHGAGLLRAIAKINSILQIIAVYDNPVPANVLVSLSSALEQISEREKNSKLFSKNWKEHTLLLWWILRHHFPKDIASLFVSKEKLWICGKFGFKKLESFAIEEEFEFCQQHHAIEQESKKQKTL